MSGLCATFNTAAVVIDAAAWYDDSSMSLAHSEPAFISVSEVVQVLQIVLDRAIPQLAFVAEISELTRAASGHLYLSLKDERSQVSAVMWKGSVRTLGFVPERGMSVHCFGKPAIYAANGRLQIVLSHMAPAGEGALQKKFLELKARLEKEGLFSPERKRPLPYLPRAIGIVTSKTGAVIHDMMVKFRERMPQIPLYLMNVRVQGEGAAQEIAAAVEYFSQSELVDVVIVARGGGSLEDLWAFNEEVVVRAIFSSRVPVISGVGHEVDVTLADFAADARAPTPTAAAEMAVPHRGELLRRLDQLGERLGNTDRWFLPLVQRLDEMELSLKRRMVSRMETVRMMFESRILLLEKIRPVALLERHHLRLDMIQQRFGSAMQRVLEAGTSRLSTGAAKLEGVSPRRILDRGFSIVENERGIVRDATELRSGEKLMLRLARGRVKSTVDTVMKDGE